VFRILVVGDNALDVRLLQILFQSVSQPFHLESAREGSEALAFLNSLKSKPGSTLPNLILMDLNMPRVDGVETLQAIKSDPELSLIPVIMCQRPPGSPTSARAIRRAPVALCKNPPA
jgi:two-component system, chemotaxis family, response regulator Rcp1